MNRKQAEMNLKFTQEEAIFLIDLKARTSDGMPWKDFVLLLAKSYEANLGRWKMNEN